MAPARLDSGPVEIVETTRLPDAFILPNRLTTQGVGKRRQAAGRLVAGAASAADVEAFKGRTSHLHKPLALRWDHRLSHESHSRGGSSLKQAARYLSNPGLISLGGGLPSSEYFPFEEISFRSPVYGGATACRNGSRDAAHIVAGKHDMAHGKSMFDISTAAQYGLGHGAPQLLRWLVEHTEIVHDPPYQDWSCTMSIGSTSSWELTLRMFTQPGDFVLSEQYTYPAAVEAAAPMGVRFAAVGMDSNGMLPDSLDDVLTNWDARVRGGPKPFLLYTVPTGQNPTGSTQTLERRLQIYEVARKHDLYIFEDEPYYFLQMAAYTGYGMGEVDVPASHADFLKSLVPSFLAIDEDGRVMRADSFSKVIAPGSRLGWITASEQVVERFRRHTDVCTQGPSGFSQLLLFKLLEEQWGHAGYLDWLIHIRSEYTQRRDAMMAACDRYLPADVASWVPPTAGMFHWIHVDYTKHPAYLRKTFDELEEDIFQTFIKHGTLLMKGSWFYADRHVERCAMFFRATYGAARFDQIDEAIKRLGRAIREAFGIPSHAGGPHTMQALR